MDASCCHIHDNEVADIMYDSIKKFLQRLAVSVFINIVVLAPIAVFTHYYFRTEPTEPTVYIIHKEGRSFAVAEGMKGSVSIVELRSEK